MRWAPLPEAWNKRRTCPAIDLAGPCGPAVGRCWFTLLEIQDPRRPSRFRCPVHGDVTEALHQIDEDAEIRRQRGPSGDWN